jgi:hypothetical protein
MAIVDFTPVQSLLGREVCFRDLAFDQQFESYKPPVMDSELFKVFSESRFKSGHVLGCTVDIDNSGAPSFAILLEDEYFHLSELELLFVS